MASSAQASSGQASSAQASSTAFRSMLMAGGETGFLLGARLFLILRLPFLVRHAVDDLARLGIGQVDAALAGGGTVPFRQAVAAEAGKVHQIDILHVLALAQMLDEAAEGRGLQLDAGLIVHRSSPLRLRLYLG